MATGGKGKNNTIEYQQLIAVICGSINYGGGGAEQACTQLIYPSDSYTS